ncbi:MAG: polyprenyl synthetase family protein [Chloroflexi bacterium]|nr:MAG: polyprenyl synthetase family protein [Chloroflexota bacterium]
MYNKLSTIHEIIRHYTPHIEQTIRDALNDSPPFLKGVIEYHIGWANQDFRPVRSESGKMLRPVLSLLVFEALTGRFQPALPAAAAIELIHNFTLLHDDIEDNDHVRRGRPTAWTIWGQPLVINAGDYLYTLAFRTLGQLSAEHFSAGQILAVQNLVVTACLELTKGQDLDIRFEQSQTVTTEMYLDMVYKKTGALLEAAILSGAVLGSNDESVIENYRVFARNLGIAFQIQDDMLGIWGDSDRTGKSADNDLRRKKKTLPVLYTLEQTTGARGEQLRQLYAASEPLSDAEIGFVRECLALAGAQSYARQKADATTEAAFSALAQIPISNPAQTNLQAIARFLMNRTR